jgi:hypothetical protein
MYESVHVLAYYDELPMRAFDDVSFFGNDVHICDVATRTRDWFFYKRFL